MSVCVSVGVQFEVEEHESFDLRDSINLYIYPFTNIVEGTLEVKAPEVTAYMYTTYYCCELGLVSIASVSEFM